MGVRQYTWDGTAWVEVGSAVGFQDSTTAQKGLVQLSDTYTSSDSTKAATQTAVYNLYSNTAKVTYAATAPSSPKTGDFWVDSDDTTVANPAVYSIVTRTLTSNNYTLASDLSDIYDKMIQMNSASANTLTIPTNATAAYPIGCQIRVMQIGAGKTQIVAASGVTLNSPVGSTVYVSAQWGMVTLIKRDTNSWVALDNVSAS